MPNTLSHFADKKKDKSYIIEDIIDSKRSKFEFAEEKRRMRDRILPIRRTRMVGRRRGEGDKEHYETGRMWEDSARQCNYPRHLRLRSTWVIDIITCI